MAAPISIDAWTTSVVMAVTAVTVGSLGHRRELAIELFDRRSMEDKQS